jgi:nicotinate-nucleotide adenylyltransferase
MQSLEHPPKEAPPQPEQPRRPRLAVFGGSFDPIHQGHMFIAGEILRQDRADEVIFIPAHRPPHKLDRIMSPTHHRLAMLQAAIETYDSFSLSDIELQQSGAPSYTINTLETLRRIYNDSEILFIMGLDSLVELDSWYRASELVSRNEFIIFPRPDIEFPSRLKLQDKFGARNAKKLIDSILPIPGMPISSTMVRDAAAAGKSLAGLAPTAVERYIRENKLYHQHTSTIEEEEEGAARD